jgi:hypothetical protein
MRKFLVTIFVGCLSLIILTTLLVVSVGILYVRQYGKYLEQTQAQYNKIIWQSCQPKNLVYEWEKMQITYPYCLSVMTAGRGEPPGYYLFVGAGKQTDIGHRQKYSFSENSENIEAYIRQSATQWTPKGITFIEKSGRKKFIPKHNFLGGR